MKKIVNSFLIVLMLISLIGSYPVNAAGEKPFNYTYVGWNYGKEGKIFNGIIPALNNSLAQRPWQLLQWTAQYKFPNGTVTTQPNYDAFSIKKKYDSDNFLDENGFGLIHKSDASVRAFFDLVMKDEGKLVTKEQLDFFRNKIIERSHNVNLKEGHPNYFVVDNKEFLYIPGVIPWMGGMFEKVETKADKTKVPNYVMSEWPKMWVNTSTDPIKMTFKAYGYSDRSIRIIATKKGAYPNLTQVVSLTNGKPINTDLPVYEGSITLDSDDLISKLGTTAIDIVIDDGYGRTIVESVTLKKKTDNKVDFVPTKLNLTDEGQLWMTFRYDGESTIKSSTVQNSVGMPMLAQVKIGGAITTDFDLSMMYKQLPADLVPKATYNVMLGKINIGDKPGKYYIKITGIVNNPSHPNRAKESPVDAYKNNEIQGEWVREISADAHDLIAISVTTSPSSLTDKQSTTIKADVKNLGPSAQEDVRIRFFSNGKQIYEVKKDLPANKTVQVGGFTYKPGNAGAYSISVHVDPLSESKDKNRANNVATTGCIVSSGDPVGTCSSPEIISGNWDVTYSLITGYEVKKGYYSWTDSNGNAKWESYTYTDYNDPIWSTRKVSYKESLKLTGSVNTKQGIATDPKKPKESDRESRGSWEIIPYAKQKGMNPNEITRAGYGFELKVTTSYSTDWETKVPSGYENTAKPIGTKPKGVQQATAKIYNSAGKYVSTVSLDKTYDDGNTATFELPYKSYKDSVTGKSYSERKFLTDPKAPDGKYRIEVQTGAAGITGISSCRTFYVTIYGSMYDDVQNLGVD